MAESMLPGETVTRAMRRIGGTASSSSSAAAVVLASAAGHKAMGKREKMRLQAAASR